MSSSSRVTILAVASGGGHWVQLLRLRPAFEGCRVAYATVNNAYRNDVAGHSFYCVRDATRWNKVGLVIMLLQIAWVILRVRPNIIISSGAAPGYAAIRIGKLAGARTIWLDSIANVEQLSLAGQKVGRHADLWLTQWEHLARPEGPCFKGAVV